MGGGWVLGTKMSWPDWLDPRTSEPLVCCDAAGMDCDECTGLDEAGEAANADGAVRGGGSANVGAAPGTLVEGPEAEMPKVDICGAKGPT